MRARMTAAVILAVIATAGLAGCSDEVRDAGAKAEKIRRGDIGRLADGACGKVADAVPPVKEAFDKARQALLNGDRSRARALVDNAMNGWATKVSFDVRIAMKACRATMGS